VASGDSHLKGGHTVCSRLEGMDWRARGVSEDECGIGAFLASA
jgi:hypothetical protein